MRLLFVLLISSPWLVRAEDARLNAIHDTLSPLRNTPIGDSTPVLTDIKHQLREWVESRTSVLKWSDAGWVPNPAVLQEQLNAELSRADLSCGPRSKVPCPQWSFLGFLGPVVIEVKWGFLMMRTAVGIQACGYDESAYVYESRDGRWSRFWQTEQNNYEPGKYLPQRLREVAISPSDFHPKADKTQHLILTLGNQPWCSSNWHDVYYRVWETKAAYAEPKLFLSGSEWADVENPIRGSVTANDVLIEYSVMGIEGGFTRPEIRHYRLTSGKLERVDPVALTPHDFVAFWLGNHGPEDSRWSDQATRSKLEHWVQANKGPFSEFSNPTLHCKQHPDLWQLETNIGEHQERQAYFLIRWRPPYRFSMISIADHPWPDCTERDREADEPRSLFPDQ